MGGNRVGQQDEGGRILAHESQPAEPFERRRIERPDGRYVLLYSFPDGPSGEALRAGAEDDRVPPAEPERRDV